MISSFFSTTINMGFFLVRMSPVQKSKAISFSRFVQRLRPKGLEEGVSGRALRALPETPS
jgi:hypothetical protein